MPWKMVSYDLTNQIWRVVLGVVYFIIIPTQDISSYDNVEHVFSCRKEWNNLNVETVLQCNWKIDCNYKEPYKQIYKIGMVRKRQIKENKFLKEVCILDVYDLFQINTIF